MSDEYRSDQADRAYILVGSLENGEYLFKTEYGSLLTEEMVKQQLLRQFSITCRKFSSLTGKQRLHVRLEIMDVPLEEKETHNNG